MSSEVVAVIWAFFLGIFWGLYLMDRAWRYNCERAIEHLKRIQAKKDMKKRHKQELKDLEALKH